MANNQLSKQVNNLRSMLERGKSQLELAMAEHVNPERMIRLALTAATHNPKLLECNQQSIGLALLTASQLGIEPNGRDGHLVPYKRICQFIPDYKGLIKLAYMNKRVSFSVAVVYEHDDFEVDLGTDAKIRHKPTLIGDRGQMIAAYAICKLKDAEDIFVVMNKEDILKRRAMAQTTKVWDAWPEEQWKKTVLKNLSKLVPLGPQFEQAVSHDNSVEAGKSSPITASFANLTDQSEDQVVDVSDDSDKTGSQKLTDQLNKSNESESGAEEKQEKKPPKRTRKKNQEEKPVEENEPVENAPKKKAFDLYISDLEAADSIEKLDEIKQAALMESQQGNISNDEWQQIRKIWKRRTEELSAE